MDIFFYIEIVSLTDIIISIPKLDGKKKTSTSKIWILLRITSHLTIATQWAHCEMMLTDLLGLIEVEYCRTKNLSKNISIFVFLKDLDGEKLQPIGLGAAPGLNFISKLPV